jgi:hypothetical protein
MTVLEAALKQGANKLLGAAVPLVGAATTGWKFVKAVDDKVTNEAIQSVLDANGYKPGVHSLITPLLPIASYCNREQLRGYVGNHGGTAWFQTSANTNSVQAFHHTSASFQPKGTDKSHVGTVVRGKQDTQLGP